MKTSTLLLILLFINSGFLAGHFWVQIIGQINPLVLGGSELFIGIIYYIHTILKDVRKAFDVDIKF